MTLPAAADTAAPTRTESPSTRTIIILVARLGDVLGIVSSGPFANLLRRKTVGYAGVILTTLLSVPFVLAILSKNIVLTLILQFLITLLGVGLIGQDAVGKWYYIPITYGMYCLVAVVALVFTRETRDVPLEALDEE